MSERDNCKYLEVSLDKKLTFGQHLIDLINARNKGIICLRTLYPLIARNSTLPIENKSLVYKMVIRPTMIIYAAPVWIKATSRNYK